MTEHSKMLEISFRDYETFCYVRQGIGQYIQDSLEQVSEFQGLLLEAAVNEAVNNAINHGGSKTDKKLVKIKLERKDKKLVIRVKDNGPGFPGNQKLKELSAYMEKLDNAEPKNLLLESGRGLLLMKSVADEVRYNKKGNEVILIKSIS